MGELCNFNTTAENLAAPGNHHGNTAWPGGMNGIHEALYSGVPIIV